MALALAAVAWVAIIIAGTVVGSRKNRTLEGVAWTLFLGVIGLIVIACRGSRAGSPSLAGTGASVRNREELAGGSRYLSAAEVARNANRLGRSDR